MIEEPDRLEKGIRFGCGSVIGILIGLDLTYSMFLEYPGHLFIAACIFALVCGILAMKYGDRFWDGVIQFLRPWQ
jgi:hypothetical protein